MVIKRNQFIDDDDLTETSSLIHLLDRHDVGISDEAQILKHSPFYSETQFIDLLSSQSGLCVLDLNIANIFTKFDELKLFVERTNISNSISVICLNECWLDKDSDVSFLTLPNYKMYSGEYIMP